MTGAPLPAIGGAVVDGAVDEAAGPAAGAVMAALAGADLDRLVDAVADAVAGERIMHVAAGAAVLLHVDPVPRVIGGAEWDRLAAGLGQRVRALEAFLRDPAEAVRAGVLPGELVDTCIYREPDVPPPPVPLGVAGPDVVRGADGALVVLEDNLRTPTLMGYAEAVGRCVRAQVAVPGLRLRPPADGLAAGLSAVLRAAAPDVEEPVIAVLGDAASENVRWEPEHVAGMLGVPLVSLRELRGRGDRVLLPDGRPVDVLWRRTSEERLRDDAGRLNAFGEALLPALRAETLRVVNPFGTGIADDKRTYAYVEELTRLYLGEEPLMRSVSTYDLGDPARRALAEPRLDELVLKPRSGSGGHGVVVMPLASAAARDRARRAVRADPASWVAQELVALSTCPTVVAERLVDRHVDLRPCVLSTGSDVRVLPGGVSRVTMGAGQLVVNLSQGGAAKDTWVVDGPADSAARSSDGQR